MTREEVAAILNCDNGISPNDPFVVFLHDLSERLSVLEAVVVARADKDTVLPALAAANGKPSADAVRLANMVMDLDNAVFNGQMALTEEWVRLFRAAKEVIREAAK